MKQPSYRMMLSLELKQSCDCLKKSSCCSRWKPNRREGSTSLLLFLARQEEARTVSENGRAKRKPLNSVCIAYLSDPKANLANSPQRIQHIVQTSRLSRSIADLCSCQSTASMSVMSDVTKGRDSPCVAECPIDR